MCVLLREMLSGSEELTLTRRRPSRPVPSLTQENGGRGTACGLKTPTGSSESGQRGPGHRRAPSGPVTSAERRKRDRTCSHGDQAERPLPSSLRSRAGSGPRAGAEGAGARARGPQGAIVSVTETLGFKTALNGLARKMNLHVPRVTQVHRWPRPSIRPVCS